MKRLNINFKRIYFLQAILVDIVDTVTSDGIGKNCCMVTYRAPTVLTDCYSDFSAGLDKTLIGRIFPVADGKIEAAK